ncbi:MAG: MSCRAMM family adhesin SdrC, partial [Bacilli bacterium]|nr:MSCRAMM family adhesin SdrC [Bacilli bacterium]
SNYLLADNGYDSIVDVDSALSNSFTLSNADVSDKDIGMAADISVSISPTSHNIKVGSSGISTYTVTNGTFNSSSIVDSSVATKTDNSGSIEFTGLSTGSTSATLTFKDGYQRTRSDVNKTITIKVEGLIISGNVFDDENYNSLNDDSNFMVGLDIELVDGSTGTLIATTTTDAAGDYFFDIDSINADGYMIQVVAPSGYILANNDGDSVVDYDTGLSTKFTLSGSDITNKHIGMALEMAIGLSPLTHTVYVGDTVVSNLALSNGKVADITINNSNVSASINTNLEIVGLSKGTSLVNVSFVNGYGRNEVKREVEVSILPLPYVEGEDISIKPKEIKKVINEYGPLDGSISCQSSHPNIATVDKDCLVTGKSVGSSIITITVYTKDGLKKATKDVIVSVGQEKNPTVNTIAKEVADSKNFTLQQAFYEKVLKNPQKYLKELIQLGSAKAWSIDAKSFNKPVNLVKVRILDKAPKAYLEALGGQANNDEINNNIYKIVYVEYQTAKGTITVSKVVIFKDVNQEVCIDNMKWNDEKSQCVPDTGSNSLVVGIILGLSSIMMFGLNVRYIKK